MTRFGGKEKRDFFFFDDKVWWKGEEGKDFFLNFILMTRFVGKEKREKLRRRRSCRLWTRRTLSALSGSRCSFFSPGESLIFALFTGSGGWDPVQGEHHCPCRGLEGR